MSSLTQLFRALIATLHSRAELLGLELARERTHIVRLALLSVAALFFLILAAFTATVFVILAFWDSHRVAAAGVLLLVYVAICAVLGLLARREAASAARPFASTVEQLRKDRDAFR